MNKKKLGILIGVLRKEKYTQTKNNKWLQVNFCDGICSKSTLSRLEAGLIVSYEEVYIELSNRLGYGYASIDLIDSTLELLEKRLLVDVDFGHDRAILTTLEKMKKLLALSHRFIYYHQLGLMVEDLIMYYTNYTFKHSFNLVNYIAILQVTSDDLATVIRMYLYLCIHNTQEDIVYDKLVHLLNLDQDKSLAVQICYFHYLFVKQDQRVIDLFIPLWMRANVRRKRELQSLLKLYEGYFNQRLPAYLFSYLDIKLETRSIMSQLNEGTYQLQRKNRLAFSEICEQMFSVNQPVPTITFFQYLYETNNRKYGYHYSTNQQIITREFHKFFLSYLTLDDEKERQSYIMQVLYEQLKGVDHIYLNFFTREIIELSKSTKRYKDLHRMLELYQN